MTSSTLQQLYNEHEVITRVADHALALLDAPDLESHAGELQWIISFFREYGDGYHHVKEEEVLFPRLTQANPTVGMMVESLTDHHVLFRQLLQRADEALAARDWATLDAVLRGYTSNLCDHISAENDELFVLAEEVLNEEEKRTISFLFIDRDSERGTLHKQALEDHAANL